MSENKLFSSYTLGNATLNNRIVMAPMTRSRALKDNAPADINALYYGQRAGAGLIITEGTSPSPNGLGYPRIPGIFSDEQTKGWKLVADAVHAEGGKVFVQLMHTGRVTAKLNLPEGAKVLAPSALQLEGEMYTDEAGNQPHDQPEEMTREDIEIAINEYVQAAKNAIAAGLDGVELHGANGYLINQFLHPNSNHRTDEFGGNAENRNRFAVEVANRVIEAIGADKVGMRISPYGVYNGMGAFEGNEDQYVQLAKALSDLNLQYIHMVDHSAMGAPEVPVSIKQKIREAFAHTLILSGGYDKTRAEADLASGAADLIAFGRPFISNPDLVDRLKADAELAQPDFDTFYTPTEKGYTDYPALNTQEA